MEDPLQELCSRVGAAVRSIRKARRLSQGEVAKKANIALRSLVVVERGEGNPRLATLFSIAKALDVRTADLIRARDSGPLGDELSREMDALIGDLIREARAKRMDVARYAIRAARGVLGPPPRRRPSKRKSPAAEEG